MASQRAGTLMTTEERVKNQLVVFRGGHTPEVLMNGRPEGFLALLNWLEDKARHLGCAALTLDSGVQRHDAHRFYFREGMTILAYSFRKALK